MDKTDTFCSVIMEGGFLTGAAGWVVTDLGASAAASVSVHVVQAQDLEGAEGCGSRLGGDHPSEPGHRPRPHVVVVSANW